MWKCRHSGPTRLDFVLPECTNCTRAVQRRSRASNAASTSATPRQTISTTKRATWTPSTTSCVTATHAVPTQGRSSVLRPRAAPRCEVCPGDTGDSDVRSPASAPEPALPQGSDRRGMRSRRCAIDELPAQCPETTRFGYYIVECVEPCFGNYATSAACHSLFGEQPQ
jgi:hypothetical protein